MKNKLAIGKAGDLSVFPYAKDSKFTLHQAVNNAQDYLKQTLAINSKYLILQDSSKFPDSGIIKITPINAKNLLDSFELIFYGRKLGNQLHALQRGYKGSSPNIWPAGSLVSCPLMAEHHNAIKDAIIKIQKKIGLNENPSSDSLNGVLNYLENKWLAPKPVFRGYPLSGPAPLHVTFHNFSTMFGGRFLWDFGDGTNSTERNPIHTYTTEGIYTVRLTAVSVDKSQGLTEKKEYVEVNNKQLPAFFYISPLQGSITTDFTFMDQSDGNIIERHWFFGDGVDYTASNPNIHSVIHRYEKNGTYQPTLILRLSDNSTRRIHSDGIEVI